MVGRTSLAADKDLNLLRAVAASPFDQTWVSLFTTNPTADHPTLHGAVEWGPPRIRVFPNSAAGSPHWSEPSDLTAFVRYIGNVGSLVWSSITLSSSPGTVIGVGVFDSSTGGNLLTWNVLDQNVAVADGENHVFGTNDLKITGD